jgi:hypothetical protein
MDIDAKHKVLYAIYAEFQKAITDMPSLTFEVLDMDSRAFEVALWKLRNEGFILELPHSNMRSKSKAVNLGAVIMTRFGVEYVESQLEIVKASTEEEKLRQLEDKFAQFGWEALQSLVSRVLVDMTGN